MIIKFEKETIELKEGVEEKYFKEIEKDLATHIHYCGHDANPPEQCRRVKI